MTIIKICGLTLLEDALAAAEAGADMLGFNFYEAGPRYISPEKALTISEALWQEFGEAAPTLVGVFVNYPPRAVEMLLERAGLALAQLHGDEPPEVLAALEGLAYKAIRPQTHDEAVALASAFARYAPAEVYAPGMLVDAYSPALYGGTGEEAGIDIALTARACAPRMMLAGGLTPDNVAARIAAVRPWGVDTASGVEGPGRKGIKDHGRIRAFIETIRALDAG